MKDDVIHTFSSFSVIQVYRPQSPWSVQLLRDLTAKPATFFSEFSRGKHNVSYSSLQTLAQI